MAGSSILTSVGASLSSLGMPRTASVALKHAAHALSREPNAASPGATPGHVPERVQALLAGARPVNEEEQASRSASLPDGFVPIREAQNLALLGRWPLLEDGAPACMPLKLLLTMMNRCEYGDANAEAWLKLYQQAFSGEAAAQFAFGKVCENGSFRAPADLQRAFFWYYRAALQGDIEARHSAERVARAAVIAPATVSDPDLVYPGSWRIAAEMPGGASSSSLFELADGGRARGCLIGRRDDGKAAVRAGPAVLVGPCAMFLLSPQASHAPYNGQWSYHGGRRILTFDFTASAAGIPGMHGDAWQIELTGCRMGALFGRDRRMVSYTLEHEQPQPGRDAQPARRVAAGR